MAAGIFLGSSTSSFPLLGAGQQFAERVGDQGSGGLVAGEEQAVEDRGDLVVGDFGAFMLSFDQVCGEVVAAFVVGNPDQAQAFLPVLHEVVGVRDLLLVAEVAPGHGGAGVAPALEGVHLGDVGADQGEDGDGGDVVGEVLDHVPAAVRPGEHPFEQVDDVLPDEGFQGLVAAGRERLLDHGADAGVFRRSAGGKARVCGEAAVVHDLLGGGAAFADRSLGVFAGEGLPVLEDGLDVVIAGDDVEADPFVEHHGLLGPEFGVGREGVLHLERLVAVVTGGGFGAVPEGAAAGRFSRR